MSHTSRLSLVAIASALAAASASPALGADKVSVQLSWILNVQQVSYLMAREKGFYKDADLDVEIRPGSVQVNPNPLVATGQATFGNNDTPNLINARAQGMPLLAVAACWQIHPGGVYALTSSNIKTPKDLVGKTLAYDVGGPWTLVQAMLAKSGVDKSQVKLVNAAGNEILMKGTVDARTGFVINGPVTIKLAGMDTTVLRAGDYGVPAYADVIFTSEDYAKKNPDVVRRFVGATIRGYEYAYAHKDETLKTLAAANPQLNIAVESLQFDLQQPLIFTDEAKAKGLCQIDGAKIAETYDIMKTYGGLTASVDTAKMYTGEFLPKK